MQLIHLDNTCENPVRLYCNGRHHIRIQDDTELGRNRCDCLIVLPPLVSDGYLDRVVEVKFIPEYPEKLPDAFLIEEEIQ